MIKLTKYVLASILAFTFLVASSAWSADENGVTTVLGKDAGVKFKSIACFTAYDLGTDAGGTEVFNIEEEVAISSGAVNVRRYRLGQVQINYPTIGSTGIDFNIYGRLVVGGTTAWQLLWQEQVTSTDDSATGVTINISDDIDDVRVGCQATGTPGTDIITVIAKFKEGD